MGTKTIFDMGKNLRVTPEKLQLFERIIAEPFNPQLLHSSLHQVKQHEEALKNRMEKAALLGLEVPDHAMDALKYLQETIFRAVALAPKDLHDTPPDHPNCRCMTSFSQEMETDFGGVDFAKGTTSSKEEAEAKQTSFLDLMKKLGKETRGKQGGWASSPSPNQLPVQGLMPKEIGSIFNPTRVPNMPPPTRFIKAILKEAIKFIREHQSRNLDPETGTQVKQALEFQESIRKLYPELYEEVNKELDAEVEAYKKELKEKEETAIENAKKTEEELTQKIREQEEVKERLRALGKKIRGHRNGRKEVPKMQENNDVG